jgi:cyclopropane fatty-acyl-phospholipid synthase-like methyltransferase
MATEDFYDALAPFYHLIYPDWHASSARQAAALDAVIRAELGDADGRTVLDVACGIGTQALGMAALGYAVTASDLSAGAVRRLRGEAAARGLSIDARVAGHARRVGRARPHLSRGALRRQLAPPPAGGR